MRGLLVIALYGACTFTPGQAASPGGPSGGNQGGMAPDAAPIARPACDISDSSIQLCLDFEMPQELGLDSSAGHHDATVTSATPVTRATSEQAVSVVMGSTIQVGETSALDIQDVITYELWLSPTSNPASGNKYLPLENHGQYWMTVEDDGRVRCYVAGKYAESADPIPLADWTHVACTYDRLMITVYVNGDASNCYQTSGQISTSGTAGTTIGEPFIGSIDNVHVYSREVLPNEICTHAGRTSCDGFCNPG